MIKEEFYFDSRDGENRIHAVRYTPDDGNVRGIVQIVHGMAEYVERYENLAEFLTKRGILVTGEEVVLPQMLCCPGSAVGPHAVVCSIHRSGYSPDVGVVVCYPTVGAIQCLCSLGTSGGKVVDK